MLQNISSASPRVVEAEHDGPNPTVKLSFKERMEIIACCRTCCRPALSKVRGFTPEAGKRDAFAKQDRNLRLFAQYPSKMRLGHKKVTSSAPGRADEADLTKEYWRSEPCISSFGPHRPGVRACASKLCQLGAQSCHQLFDLRLVVCTVNEARWPFHSSHPPRGYCILCLASRPSAAFPAWTVHMAAGTPAGALRRLRRRGGRPSDHDARNFAQHFPQPIAQRDIASELRRRPGAAWLVLDRRAQPDDLRQRGDRPMPRSITRGQLLPGRPG
jgi:hypothetical protein